MERRKFLRQLGLLAGASTMSLSLGNIPLRAFGRSIYKTNEQNGKVLVLIQMSGGNDGLNTVIPYEDSLYYNARPNIAIKKSDVIRLNPLTGIHDSLQPFKEFYDEGKLAIVQNVGYPSHNRSHFRSTDIWLSGSDSNEYLNDGWVGRYLGHSVSNDTNYNLDHPMAISLGSTQDSLLSCTCQSGSMGISFEDPNQFFQLINGSSADTDPPPNTIAGNQLKYVKEIAARSIKFAEIIKEKADTINNQVNYPNSDLADQLSIIAQLVAGGLETPVYLASIGGFDTHSNQLGRHSNLLSNVAQSLSAFQRDLELLGAADRVVTMTFSEFGRTVQQNGSGGTDHGAAAPLFLMGKNVNGGIWGNNPDLSDLDSSGDNKYKYDFRQIYATLLRDQLNAGPEEMDNILFKDFETLPLISVKNITSGGPRAFELNQNYPNPFNPKTQIGYTLRLPQEISLKVYDANGRLVKTLFVGRKDAGTYYEVFGGSQYPSGIYYCHLISGSYRKTIKMTLVK
ncbi:MAG: DUF1501 domain-containing protein [Melioribacteraceae bacterium]|nr:DUF1501 domain-containing protein [Melioribacteraceae bacterium]